MDSASRVGEIFKRAGEAYNKLGDKVVMLHPAAQELIQVEQKQQEESAQQKSPGGDVLPDVNALLNTAAAAAASSNGTKN